MGIVCSFTELIAKLKKIISIIKFEMKMFYGNSDNLQLKI